MEPTGVAFLTLAALLTGALLPLIFQVRATLRSAQRALDSAGPKLAQTLTEMATATQDFNVVTKDVAATLDQVRGTVRTVSAIGSAVGPAVVAAVQAFKAIRAEDALVDHAPPTDPARKPGGQAAN